MALVCLHQATAGEVLAIIREGRLAEHLRSRFIRTIGRRPSESEVSSWVNSIPTVVELLVDAGLRDVQILLELKAPITDARMDMVLIGSHPRSGELSVVVVENKQWSQLWPEPDTQLVHVPQAPGENPRLHPANQVHGYCQVLTDFVPLLRMATVYGVVNMHNALGVDLTAILPAVQGLDGDTIRDVRIFGRDQRADFQAFLKETLSPEKAASFAEDLSRAPVRPTDALMSVVSEAVSNRNIFPLLNEQREAYDYVMAKVAKMRKGDHKEVVLVVGGPGTGKSVIALELLGTLNRQAVATVHATGSRSFTQTLRENVGKVNRRAKSIFAYFNNFAQAEHNELAVLIADEAHRIRESSNHRFTRRDKRSTLPQIRELINAAQVPVFLLDENQAVRRGEVGSIQLIRDTAKQMKYGVRQINLDHQFRCGGCPEYVEWVEQLLGFVPGLSPQKWKPVDTFDLYVADTPAVMEDYLRAKADEGHTARIAAGYCWPWSDVSPDGELVDDITIGDWKRPWNSRAERKINGIPPSAFWATDPAGFGQIGCIYTAQGFEYDYAGVILGPDLTWTGSGWKADPKASRDTMVNKSPDFDQLVRNTYRVLATRGMRGAVLYSTDPATRDMLSGLGLPSL